MAVQQKLEYVGETPAETRSGQGVGYQAKRRKPNLISPAALQRHFKV